MFIGMENIILSNHPLADEALFAANSMCDGDPLLANERGVMAFNHGEYVSVNLQSSPLPQSSSDDLVPNADMSRLPNYSNPPSTWLK